MKSTRVVLVIGILFFVNSQAQIFDKVSPAEAGLSSQRLERLSGAIQKHIDNGEIAGAVTLISRHGKIGHLKSQGMLSIENNIPMSDDAIFRIASMTKLVTSIAVMILYEEGDFFLTDPVYKYIPEFKDIRVAEFDDDGNIIKTVPTQSPVTIQNLLTHTSGLIYGSLFGGEYAGLENLYKSSNLDIDQQDLHSFVTELTKLPLAFQPGTKWKYSYSIDVLGYLVEVISGKKLNQFCKERIFEPLGMKDTDFYVPKDKMNRFTTLYSYKDGKLIPVDSPNATVFDKIPYGCSGGGGIVSTAPDYAVIGQMLLNSGSYNGVQLLGKKTIELMMTNHLTGISKDKWFEPYAGFGLGGAIIDDVGLYGEYASKGYFWWAGIFNTYFFVDPVEDMFAILMVQVSPFTHVDLMKRFKNFVYQAIVE